MAKRNREELIADFTAYAGERNDDETLTFMENLSDSFPDGEDWKAKYEENDRAWRERYRSRFLTMSNTGTLEPDPPETEETHDDVDVPSENDQIEKSVDEQLDELFDM